MSFRSLFSLKEPKPEDVPTNKVRNPAIVHSLELPLPCGGFACSAPQNDLKIIVEAIKIHSLSYGFPFSPFTTDR